MDYEKITIGKDTKKERKIPKRYIPKTLSKEDKKKQERSILQEKKRPKLKSFESKRSPFVQQFENKYGFKINNFSRINKQIITRAGINKIMAKGRAAYFSSGSRPNQSSESWALARLASVIMGGKARGIDQKIWDRFKR